MSPLPSPDARVAGLPDSAFFFTRDPRLLREYRALYEREFSGAHGEVAFRYLPDDNDRHGHILVIVHDGRCVGGARLNLHDPSRPGSLPIELDGFSLRDRFPHLRD